MKATVVAESYNYSSIFIVICLLQPGRCHSLSFLLTYLLSFYLSRFSFYSNILILCNSISDVYIILTMQRQNIEVTARFFETRNRLINGILVCCRC